MDNDFDKLFVQCMPPDLAAEIRRAATACHPDDREGIRRELRPTVDGVGRAAMRWLADMLEREGLASADQCRDLADNEPVFPAYLAQIEARLVSLVDKAQGASGRHRSN